MSNLKKMEWQRKHRAKTDNIDTKKYEKTHKGFLMRLYRNMESRIYGIQKKNYHLYNGKEILSRDEFYRWGLYSADFYRLFNAYQESGYSRKLAPSVDRIDSSKGYTIDNMEWVTMSENSRRGTLSKCIKYGYKIQAAQ